MTSYYQQLQMQNRLDYKQNETDNQKASHDIVNVDMIRLDSAML